MWHSRQAKRANTQLKPGGGETLQGKEESNVYQQWISVEQEKALRFIQQDLTFGVYQQTAFYSLQRQERRVGVFKYCMRCDDKVQSAESQRIILHGCSRYKRLCSAEIISGTSFKPQIKHLLVLFFFFIVLARPRVSCTDFCITLSNLSSDCKML